MKTFKTLVFAALLSTIALVSVAQAAGATQPAAGHHSKHVTAASKSEHKHVKPKAKAKKVAHAAKKPGTKKSKASQTSVVKKKTAPRKTITAVHGISVAG